MTDFIRNTKRELYDEMLDHELAMFDLECSKDDDTKTQCNCLNTGPLHRENTFNNMVQHGRTGKFSGKRLPNL